MSSIRDTRPGGNCRKTPHTGPDKERHAFAAWCAHADELAEWAMDRLAMRCDAWGGYYVDPDGKTQPTTKPRKSMRGKLRLTEDLLAAHFANRDQTDAVVGLHTTCPLTSTARWGGVDIDRHSAADDAEANLSAAKAWYARLTDMGFHPLLNTSNGVGGYHLRVLLTKATEAARVRQLFNSVTDDYASYGFRSHPEVFPKQDRIKPAGFGNWMRLPGRHHTRDHWSEVWDGKRWLRGEAAIQYILALNGDSVGLLPPLIPPPPAPRRSSARCGGNSVKALSPQSTLGSATTPRSNALLLGVTTLPTDPYPEPISLDDLINVWDRHPIVSERMWEAVGLGEQVATLWPRNVTERFCVPYGWRMDRNPSAYLLRQDDGKVVLHDHGGDGMTTFDAAHFAVCRAYRGNLSASMVKMVLSVYRVRLLIECRQLRPAVVDMPSCPEGLTRCERKVYEGIRLLGQCKGRVREWAGNPFPMSKQFMAAWCGVSDKVARSAVNKLAELRVVSASEQPERGPWLWKPGRPGTQTVRRILKYLGIDAEPYGLTEEQCNDIERRLRVGKGAPQIYSVWGFLFGGWRPRQEYPF